MFEHTVWAVEWAVEQTVKVYTTPKLAALKTIVWVRDFVVCTQLSPVAR